MGDVPTDLLVTEMTYQSTDTQGGGRDLTCRVIAQSRQDDVGTAMQCMVKLCWDRNSTCEHAMWTFALTLGGQVVFEQHLTQA